MNAPAPGPNFSGRHVCAFESRKAEEIRSLIERHGGVATVAPSMREIPLDENPAAFAFGAELLAGRVDILLLLTGVGTRALMDVLETKNSREEILAALGKCCLVVRGPKPAAVLREWKLRIDHQVPEPNTWRDLLTLLDERVPVPGKTVAVQEYGQPNSELYAGLTERGAHVVAVPVYRWALPEDIAPLRSAVRATIDGHFDVLLITSAQQVHHILQVAEADGLKDAWLAAARRCVIASIGPTASETLVSLGLPPNLEPEHPKMGHLVRAAAEHQKSAG